jgi:uncharacterized membrane protein
MVDGVMIWILGPQLIGIIVLIVGYIQKRFQPKHVNALYGYRMPSSMKNQETWDEANRFSVVVMIRYGWIVTFIGLIISFILSLVNLSVDTQYLIAVLLIIATSISLPVVIITTTEKHLRKVFKD